MVVVEGQTPEKQNSKSTLDDTLIIHTATVLMCYPPTNSLQIFNIFLDPVHSMLAVSVIAFLACGKIVQLLVYQISLILKNFNA